MPAPFQWLKQRPKHPGIEEDQGVVTRLPEWEQPGIVGQLSGEEAQAPGYSSLCRPSGPGQLTCTRPFERASSGPASLSWNNRRISTRSPRPCGPRLPQRTGRVKHPGSLCGVQVTRRMCSWIMMEKKKQKYQGQLGIPGMHMGVTVGDLHVTVKGRRDKSEVQAAGEALGCGQRDKGIAKVPADETKSVGSHDPVTH